MQFRRPTGRSSRRGSALLIAIIFSSVMLALLGGYFSIVMSELRYASRSFLLNASTNLAEGGLELAIDALNRSDNTGWSAGTDAGGKFYWAREYNGYNLGSGYSGEIKVVIIDPNSTTPSIFSEGVASGPMGSEVSKQAFISLDAGIRPFGNGFNSASPVDFSGASHVFDSYSSGMGAYGFGNVGSDVTIASESVVVDDATIHGFVLTNGADPTPSVGASGSITTITSPGIVDPTRIALDDYQNFPDVSAPAMAFPLAVLPTNGWLSAPGEYHVASWHSAGANTLFISENVTIRIDGDMTMTGGARIVPFGGARVRIFVGGDVNLSGGGIANVTGRPGRFLLVGTETVTGDQEIRIQGNTTLSAAIYAPRAEVEIDGNGRFLGAVVGHEVTFDGDTHLSFDRSLRNARLQADVYEVKDWIEYLPGSAGYLDMSSYGL